MGAYGLTTGYGAAGLGGGYGLGAGYGANCICNLPTLVILILIVLQFSRCKQHCDGEYDGDRGHGGFENQHVGNGILFIIALFFLSCAGCGRGVY